MTYKFRIDSDILKESYIYKHTRLNGGSVFYVGKGTGGRAFDPISRNHLWDAIVERDGGFNVEILATPMSNEDALNEEAKSIMRHAAIKPITNLTVSKTRVPVIKYDKDFLHAGVFDNSKEAAKVMGCTYKDIHNACMYQYRLFKGYYWRYDEGFGKIDYKVATYKSNSLLYQTIPKGKKYSTVNKVYEKDSLGNERFRTISRRKSKKAKRKTVNYAGIGDTTIRNK